MSIRKAIFRENFYSVKYSTYVKMDPRNYFSGECQIRENDRESTRAHVIAYFDISQASDFRE